MKLQTQKQILDELVQLFTDAYKKDGKKETGLSIDAKNALGEIRNNNDLMHLSAFFGGGHKNLSYKLSKTGMKKILLDAIRGSRVEMANYANNKKHRRQKMSNKKALEIIRKNAKKIREQKDFNKTDFYKSAYGPFRLFQDQSGYGEYCQIGGENYRKIECLALDWYIAKKRNSAALRAKGRNGINLNSIIDLLLDGLYA